ncbi:MAG TPA: hypothetical protein VF950_15840 [Planctomycetota bacterium]
MAMSGRVTRRAPTASQRFHGSPRSRPIFALIGGIGVCFAVVIGFVLLGGSPDVDALPDRIAQLEEKAARLSSEDKPEEAIKVYEELLSIAAGDRWRVKILEWKGAIKELKVLIAALREAKARMSAWEKAVDAATAATARPLLEEGQRLKLAYPRLWKHDAHLARLNALLPKPEPTVAETRARISRECELETRGKARWGAALREWKAWLEKPRSDADRGTADDTMKSIEQKAREEVRTLTGRAATPEAREALKLHRLRFEGTAAAAELEKAITAR